MLIKITITIEMFEWPGTRVPLGIWSRVRICRNCPCSYRTSWIDEQSIVVGDLDEPPPYSNSQALPKILIAPSTPDECEDFSSYEARTHSRVAASDENVGVSRRAIGT